MSREVLKGNGILLVFVEGFCAHQTTLQLPLKKGAPRVVDACWRQEIPVKILPVWLEYSSFTEWPKTIDIRFGEVFGQEEAWKELDPARVWNHINKCTAKSLTELEQLESSFSPDMSFITKGLLTPFAVLGAVLHAPLYLPLKAIVKRATIQNVHYDSVLFALLLFLYPIYLIGLGLALANYTSPIWFLFPVLFLPAMARAYVLWK